jgi:hypothetical protein
LKLLGDVPPKTLRAMIAALVLAEGGKVTVPMGKSGRGILFYEISEDRTRLTVIAEPDEDDATDPKETA